MENGIVRGARRRWCDDVDAMLFNFLIVICKQMHFHVIERGHKSLRSEWRKPPQTESLWITAPVHTIEVEIVQNWPLYTDVVIRRVFVE